MSEEILGFGRRMAAAYNAGLDEWMACHAEDVVHVTAPEWPERGTYHGKEAVRALWASIFSASEYKIEIDELIPLDDHRLLSKLHLQAIGPASGVTTTTPIYTVATERAGLIARINYFLSYEDALQAAGLSE
jgi:hypothetical protein